MEQIIQKGKTYYLMNGEKKLAKLKLNQDTGDTLNVSGWKSYTKGKNHGKILLKKIVSARPNLWFISTDGFTQQGASSFDKALPNFKMIEWRRGPSGGVGILMRQDAIDHYIDMNNTGRRTIWNIDPKLHS